MTAQDQKQDPVLFRTKKHKIIFLFPIILTIFVFYAINYMQQNLILDRVIWAPLVLVAVFWLYVAFNYLTSSFVVTTKRVMMREGFFNRHINDTRIATISQINIDQSLFGQILNYGKITINAFGASDTFTMIAKPLVFKKYVTEQLNQNT